MKRLVYVSMVLVLLLSLMLSACTPATPAASSTAPTSSAKPTTSAVAPAATSTTAVVSSPSPAGAPVPGGTLVMMMTQAADSFGYPPKITGPNRDYAPPFFDRLLQIDNNNVYQPQLATSWETAADGKSITFKLRQGVKFQDGTEFNADAVKFNFNELIPPKSTILDGVASIDVVDPFTLRINLSSFNNLILFQIASAYECYIVSPTAFKAHDATWAAINPVGTGPFKLSSYERGVKMTLAKNPDYWEKGVPFLDGIVINTVPDPMTQMASFKAGQANVIFDSKTGDQLRDAGYPILNAPGSIFVLSIDTKNNKTLADPRVRMAIEYAVDKEAICKGPGAGLYTPAYQIVPTGSKSYNTTLTPRKYDPAMAKKLLADAGISGGFTFKYYNLSSYWKDGIVAIQANLAAVGIKMEIVDISTAALAEIRNLGKIEAGAAGQMTMNIYSNPLYHIDLYMRTTSNNWQYVVRPAAIDALITQAKAAKDDAAMIKITQDISKLVYDDETVIPFWLNPRIVVLDKSVQNIGYFINGDSANNIFGKYTWFKK